MITDPLRGTKICFLVKTGNIFSSKSGSTINTTVFRVNPESSNKFFPQNYDSGLKTKRRQIKRLETPIKHPWTILRKQLTWY